MRKAGEIAMRNFKRKNLVVILRDSEKIAGMHSANTRRNGINGCQIALPASSPVIES